MELQGSKVNPLLSTTERGSWLSIGWRFLCFWKAISMGPGWRSEGIPSLGRSEGLLAIWKKSISIRGVKFMRVHRYVLVGIITSREVGTWCIFGVYASHSDVERRVVWDTLRSVCSLNIPVLYMGDFHEVLWGADKKGRVVFALDWIEELRSLESLSLSVGW